VADDLASILEALGTAESLELFEPHWEESMACFPAEGAWFLEPGPLTESRTIGRMLPELDPLLLETARVVRDDPALARLSWHCFRLLYEHLDYDGGKIREWPDLDRALGDRAGLFYLQIALAAAPLTQALHKQLGVPAEITRANLCNLCVHAERYHAVTGRWGTQQRLLPWMRNHTTGALYRLGRFQYMARPFRGRLQVYRRRGTNATVALADEGIAFTKEGLILPDAADAAGAWTSRFAEDDAAVVGALISPRGYAENREVRLDKHEWRRVFGLGDPVLEMHIPPGGGMTPQRTLESMRLAGEFFPRHFPDRPFAGFACTSWVFNPRFSEILAPDANIRLVEQEVHLFPIPSGPKNGLYFIFGTDDVDPATAPRDTSIRRVLLDELEAGRPLLAGGMFVLRQDLPHLGAQFYRANWPFGER